MVLLIFGLILILSSLGGLIYFISKFIKQRTIGEKVSVIDKKLKTTLLLLIVANGLSTIVSSYGLALANQWEFNVGENLLTIFGSLVLGISFATLIASFYLYYWKTTLETKVKKILGILIIVSALLTLFGLYLYSESIANQDIYPLINRIDFQYGLVNSHNDITSKYGIQFYGIAIVSGALICYFITDHESYKKFGEHGLIDTLFVIAFLAGVIGSRLWYCLILEYDTFSVAPETIITGMLDGGLAIMGGAIGGSAVGIAFVLIFRRYIDVRFLMDVAIPSILLAQVFGRWGNFFNQEVYGGIAPTWMVNMLPTIIKNNMFINGEYRVPLFLIEGLINFGGYFLIRFFFGKVCKFHWGLGYQSALYFSWYGLVRVILEPLRNAKFEYSLSIEAAYGMIIGGAVLLLALFIYHEIRMKMGLEDKFGEKIKQ